ncbi:hypothetical protein GOP47_0025389 [Adiantum capillus-veneris]|uniref:Protein disulfide isomerase-like 1-4 n=1 Tax=Adiantum capillus-veneris TaxID=13818 RepID=A0A9D4U1D6_ADICA|nr:hypothetical protein GOP47_0025389 [Adiantum capillus-veneris]
MAASVLRAPLCVLFCVAILFLSTVNASYPELDQSEIEALGLSEEDLITFDGEEHDGDYEHEYEEYEEAAVEHDEGLAEFKESEGDGNGHGGDEDSSHVDVVVLTESNFSTFLDANRFTMVEFYAPWCGHCQSLAPEYAAAATELLTYSVPVPLAKVDATEYPDLAQKYEVEGFPTILFFVNGKPKPYSYHRNREAIVTWVKKRVGPAVAKVVSINDAETILASGSTVVVAFFEKLAGPEVEEFTVAAQQEDDVLFYQIESQEIMEAFSFPKAAKAPALVLLKNASERVVFYDGIFKKDSLSEFITANKLPLVSSFNSDTATEIFESSIKKQILLFASPEDFQKILPIFEEAAKSFKGKIIFVHVDTSNEEAGKPIMHFFGVDAEKPMIVGFTVSEDQPKTYLFEDEMTFDNIKDFATSFLDNKLKQFYKSQPLPDTNNGDVTVVVGNNFDEIVLDESKDVLLEIYAPWCGHCQALEPIYAKLAKALRNVESLVIAKMDGTTNEHSRAQVDGYPTILFFAAGNKNFDPIVVDSERSVKGLYQFVKHNAGIPFTLSKAQKTNETSTSETMKALDQTEAARTEEAIETLKATEHIQDAQSQVKDEL